MKTNYNRTVQACFIGYVVQAIVNNFVPLLFLTFQGSYGISLQKITLLVTFNFGIQLLVDLASIGFVDRIGYRASMILAHTMAAAGLILLICSVFVSPMLPSRRVMRISRRTSRSRPRSKTACLPFSRSCIRSMRPSGRFRTKPTGQRLQSSQTRSTTASNSSRATGDQTNIRASPRPCPHSAAHRRKTSGFWIT